MYEEIYIHISFRSVFLSVSSTPALAVNTNDVFSSDSTVSSFPLAISVSESAHGCYLSDQTLRSNNAVLVSQNGVYETTDGMYIMHIDDDTYLEVDQIVLDLNDSASVEQTLNNYPFTEQLKNRVRNYSLDAQKNGLTDSKTIIYTSAYPINSRATESRYYTYGGYNIRQDDVVRFDMSPHTKIVASGKSTVNSIKSTVSMASSVVGVVSKTWSIVSTVGGIFAQFQQDYSNVTFSGTSSDYTEMYPTYDITHRYTYVDIGDGYRLGSSTEQVYIKCVNWRTYLFSGDRGYNKTGVTTINDYVPTANFSKPAPVSITHLTQPIDERVQYVFSFSPTKYYFE